LNIADTWKDFQIHRNEIQIFRNEIQAACNKIKIQRNKIQIKILGFPSPKLAFSMCYADPPPLFATARLRLVLRVQARTACAP
jgi:hypothetical protein